MIDRLEEIKDWLEITKAKCFGGIRPSDKARYFIDWLIAEIEDCRAKVNELHENENVESVRRIVQCLEIAIDRAENAEAEVRVLGKRVDDWRGLCSKEQTVGMGWKERALKADAEIKELKEKAAQGISMPIWDCGTVNVDGAK